MKTATFKYSCCKSDEQNVLFEFQNEMLVGSKPYGA